MQSHGSPRRTSQTAAPFTQRPRHHHPQPHQPVRPADDIEQRLAEIIRAFCADALSSTVNLNVDLDVMLAVLAQALLAALRARLPGYHAATPDTIQRRFLETPGQIITTSDQITVRLERRAYPPTLRKANLPATTTIPWLGNRTIRYELT